MNRRRWLTALPAWSAAAVGLPAFAQSAPPPLIGALKPLGQDRFQLGRIVVDKRARSFTAPGRVHLNDKPLEYLATAPGGLKAYETLFELDTTGSEFNLACILIGLERDAQHVEARHKSAAQPLLGPRVAIFITWQEGGKRRKVSAAEAILNSPAVAKPEAVEWVYTGSPLNYGNDVFGADFSGTLVGFKRDEYNVIESSVPIGFGAYGSVRGHAMLPAVDTAIELIVDALPVVK